MNGRRSAKSRLSFSTGRGLRDFRPLAVYFMDNRVEIALGILSLLMVDLLLLLIPLVIKKSIDILIIQPPGTGALLLRQALLIVALALAIAIFRYIWRRLILGHARKIEEALRNRLYAHLQTLDIGFFQKMSAGDLMARAINDINAVRMAVGMGLVALIDGTVLGVAAMGFMISIDLKLTLISLIPAPVVIVLTRALTRRMATGFESVQRSFSELTERVRESFAGIRVIKAHNREAWTCDRVKEQGEIYLAKNMTLARSLALFLPLMTIFTNAGLAVVILLGGRYAILGEITPGGFVAFISYLNLLTWPMMAMGWVANLIQRGAASMRRINSILEEEPRIKDPPNLSPDQGTNPAAASSPGSRGQIEIRGLSFTYPGQKAPALDDVSLTVHASETVALVGRVGSGKTTLLRAIPRLVDAGEGTVFLDGRDIRRIPLAILRGAIAFVPQELFLFSDTIRQNVVFGREGIDDGAVKAALETAGILDEIEALEGGLDAVLGERGITLSGGQRQRLTLARAIVRPLPILILDDALSMVDTETEEKILNRIFEIRRGMTNLIVSHRVSTIRRAHRILVLDRGRVVEEGRDEGLLASGGVYAALYEEQKQAEGLSAVS